jgi:bacterioferritin
MADHEPTQGQATEARAATGFRITGPITEAYEGDPKLLAAKLNVLRAGELAAELQYRHHAYVAVSLAMPGIKAEFLEHAAQEAHHADLLATRIQQLGLDPIFDPKDIATGAEKMRLELGDPQTLQEMIAFNYQVERRQIVAYTQLIREVAFHDPTTRRILEDILIDTEHHAAELADLLAKRSH